MAQISKFRLPVKNGSTVELIEYDLPASTPESLGFGYGVCSTAYITTAKTVSIPKYILTKNAIVSITFDNAVPSNATLSINNATAKALYHRGIALANNIIFAGDTATFVYDGYHYNLIALDRIPVVDNERVTL